MESANKAHDTNHNNLTNHQAPCIPSLSRDEILRAEARKRLERYEPPKWASNLKGVPEYKIKIALTNTPIQRWFIPGVPDDVEVYIKRDDLTGCNVSGNKARKMDFLLAEALHKDCDTVIGAGSLQSNFCRVLAVAGREMGFDVHLLLREPREGTFATASTTGNAMMTRLVGAHLYSMPKFARGERDVQPRIEQLTRSLWMSGKKPMAFPIGGSSVGAFYGHLDCFDEMINQGVLDEFTDMFMVSGYSNGAIAVGNYLTGGQLKIHSTTYAQNAEYFYKNNNRILREIGLQSETGSGVTSQELMEIDEGKGIGYGVSTREELDFIIDVATTTGVLLDPVYTVKAAMGMVKKINESREKLKGNKILFYHSGSALGLFDGRINSLLQTTQVTNKICDWTKNPHETPVLQYEASTSDVIE